MALRYITCWTCAISGVDAREVAPADAAAGPLECGMSPGGAVSVPDQAPPFLPAFVSYSTASQGKEATPPPKLRAKGPSDLRTVPQCSTGSVPSPSITSQRVVRRGVGGEQYVMLFVNRAASTGCVLEKRVEEGGLELGSCARAAADAAGCIDACRRPG
ncbi:hypothetical protein V490_01484 [Pseudogymnoascus sp. VKM F-3557]|nr:hypothetical protein V490_01484 [Pseudogymnoascus sp. VKM F-3557]